MAERLQINIRPISINPVVDQRTDTVYKLVVKDAHGEDVDLSGYTAKMELRPYALAKRCYDSLTTENGRLVVEGNGVTVVFPAGVTAGYKFREAVYDLVIISADGLQYRIAEGDVNIREGVTR